MRARRGGRRLARGRRVRKDALRDRYSVTRQERVEGDEHVEAARARAAVDWTRAGLTHERPGWITVRTEEGD